MNVQLSRTQSDVAPARGGRRSAALRGLRRHRSLGDASADSRLRLVAHHVRDRSRTLRRRPRSIASFYWGVALALVACATSSPQEPTRAGERVATVNGEIILTQDVESWATEHAVDRDAALDALIDEALLVAEARRRGQRPERSVTRRAAVQEILSEIEAGLPASAVTVDAIRNEYESVQAQMAESDPERVLPSLEDSVDEIRAMLAGRARFARLEALLQAPTLNEERVSSLLALPALD